MFPNLKSAYLGLLGEACQIADTTGLSYAVCGGWSPFLRNSNPIHHPGTKDVDLLFSDGIKVDALHDVVKSFLKAGYLPSAKHEFQILRIFQVNNCELAFNIDLLHPSESFEHAERFVDHFDFDIPLDSSNEHFLRGKSIALPDSQFIFQGDFIEWETVKSLNKSAQTFEVRVPLIEEVGVLVTKGMSCASPKRPRDIFDIYLAIKQPRDRARMLQRLKWLKHNKRSVFECVLNIQKAVAKGHLSESSEVIFRSCSANPQDAIREIRALLAEVGAEDS